MSMEPKAREFTVHVRKHLYAFTGIYAYGNLIMVVCVVCIAGGYESHSSFTSYNKVYKLKTLLMFVYDIVL